MSKKQHKLDIIATEIAEAMNSLQDDGFTANDVIIGTSLMLGQALAQVGVTLNADDPIGKILPAMIDGNRIHSN